MEKEMKSQLVDILLAEQKKVETSSNPIDFERAQTTVSIVNAIVLVHQVDKDIDKSPVNSTEQEKEVIPATMTFIPLPMKKAEGNKICSKCTAEKPVGDFYNYKASKDGKMGNCKTCHDKYVKASKLRQKQKNSGETKDLKAEQKPDENTTPKNEPAEKTETKKEINQPFITRIKLNEIFHQHKLPNPDGFELPKNETELKKLINSVLTAREISVDFKHLKIKTMNGYRFNEEVKYLDQLRKPQRGFIEAFTEAECITPTGNKYHHPTATICKTDTNDLIDRPFNLISKLH